MTVKWPHDNDRLGVVRVDRDKVLALVVLIGCIIGVAALQMLWMRG